MVGSECEDVKAEGGRVMTLPNAQADYCSVLSLLYRWSSSTMFLHEFGCSCNLEVGQGGQQSE